MRNRYFHFRDSEDISFLKDKAFGIDYKGDDDPHFTDKARHLPDYWDI